jgi:adenylate kinase|tara:strand:- start:377 stop:961 length:585 start_codon:yes stop_codon:yes gene_type:complete
MIIALTGTPGTGKTTISKILSKKLNFRYISLTDIITPEIIEYHDKVRKCYEIDVGKLRVIVKEKLQNNTIIEGHFSHLLKLSNIIIILRTDPNILKKRLKKRGYDDDKIKENLEVEALDVCLIESLEYDSNVYEIDTSIKSKNVVGMDIELILNGKGEEFKPGKISWSEDFFKKYPPNKLKHKKKIRKKRKIYL